MSALISNKKARFNYEIGESMTAGIELLGHEVKSIRNSKGSLEGSHVIVRGGEAYLIGCHIPAYQPANLKGMHDHDTERPRKLLLSKSEIRQLATLESKKGLSIIPLSIFAAGKKIKVQIAVGHGKKKFDKRQTLKKRDTDREMRRDMKK